MKTDELKATKTLIEYGIFLDLVVLTIDFCLKNNKTELLNKFKELLTTVPNYLNETEKNTFKSEVELAIDTKVNTLVEELSGSLNPDELKELGNQLKSQL